MYLSIIQKKHFYFHSQENTYMNAYQGWLETVFNIKQITSFYVLSSFITCVFILITKHTLKIIFKTCFNE